MQRSGDTDLAGKTMGISVKVKRVICSVMKSVPVEQPITADSGAECVKGCVHNNGLPKYCTLWERVRVAIWGLVELEKVHLAED